MSLHDVGTLQLERNTDGVLVNYAVAGNEAAFAILVRRHRPLMRCCAVRLLGSNAEADDVVQESCITAWQKLSTLQNGNCLKSWLMRVVRNKSMDRLRMRSSSTFPLDDNTPETLHIGPFQFVESILQSPERCRAVQDQLAFDSRDRRGRAVPHRPGLAPGRSVSAAGPP
nr:sigma factor [Cryobacterium adonitolivorans]